MLKKLTAVITREDDWYISRCVELDVVSQGKSFEEAKMNLREAVELYVESFGSDDLPENTGEILFYPLEVAVHG